MAARWRALTRKHARVLAARVASSPQNNFRVAQGQAIATLETRILIGFCDILRFAGVHSAPGELIVELRTMHRARVNDCVCLAVRLAKDLAERAPTGCEVFTVGGSKDSDKARRTPPPRSGIPQPQSETFLCGCMESVDKECRQWVGQKKTRTTGTGTVGGGGTTTTRSRTGTHTKSRAGTTTTRTWAWDRDDSEDDEPEDNSNLDGESEVEVGENEDEFVEGADATRYGDGSVLCSLGFGLRRTVGLGAAKMASSVSGQTRETEVREFDQERERERERRSRQPRAETVQGSENRSTYTKLTTMLSSPSKSSSVVSDDPTERPIPTPTATTTAGRPFTDNTGGVTQHPRRIMEVLVRTDVLMSSTVEALQKRFDKTA